MTKNTHNHLPTHKLLTQMRSDIQPDPAFREDLRAHLESQIDSLRSTEQGQLLDDAHFRLTWKERFTMNTRSWLVSGMALGLVGFLLMGLVGYGIYRNSQNIQTASVGSSGNETPEGDSSAVTTTLSAANDDFEPETIIPGFYEDDVPILPARLFEAQDKTTFYAYSAVRVLDEDGHPVTEMRYYGDKRFMIVTLTNANIHESAPGYNTTFGYLDTPAALRDGLTGIAYFTGSTLQDQVDRDVVLNFEEADDGSIGGQDRLYLETMDYSEGAQLTFILGDWQYDVLSNLPSEILLAYADILVQIENDTLGGSTGGPSPSPDMDPRQLRGYFNMLLARDILYGSMALTVEEQGQEVTEYRFFGNTRFLILEVRPASIARLIPDVAELLDIDGYDATFISGLSGTALVSIDDPNPTLQDGIERPTVGGGGGGGGGWTDIDMQYPDTIPYEDGIQLMWAVGDTQYILLSNLRSEDIIAFAEVVNSIDEGTFIQKYFPDVAEHSGEDDQRPEEFVYAYEFASGSGFGVSAGELIFQPLNFGYLPDTFSSMQTFVGADKNVDGNWSEVTLWNPETDQFVVIDQVFADESATFPSAPTQLIEVNGYAGGLIENPECAVDVIEAPPISNPGPAIERTLTCTTGASFTLVWFPPGLRVMVTGNNLPLEELFSIAESLQ